MSLEEVSASFAWLKVDVVQLANALAEGKSYFKIMSGFCHTAVKIFRLLRQCRQLLTWPLLSMFWYRNEWWLLWHLCLINPSDILWEIRDKIMALDLYDTHTHMRARMVMQFKNIFPYFTIEYHPVFMKSRTKKRLLQTLQHEKVTNCPSRTEMPEAIKLFSKGFGSIWSSLCEKKFPNNTGTGHKSFPRTHLVPFCYEQNRVWTHKQKLKSQQLQ